MVNNIYVFLDCKLCAPHLIALSQCAFCAPTWAVHRRSSAHPGAVCGTALEQPGVGDTWDTHRDYQCASSWRARAIHSETVMIALRVWKIRISCQYPYWWKIRFWIALFDWHQRSFTAAKDIKVRRRSTKKINNISRTTWRKNIDYHRLTKNSR